MEMLNLSLPATNRFATGYLAGAPEIQNFFHYQYQNKSDYEERLLELKNRTFMRKELALCIEEYMKPFPTSEVVKDSLTKLANDDNSVVVIGGQQAGILTGPLYSIHKVISIIKLAQQKEQVVYSSFSSSRSLIVSSIFFVRMRSVAIQVPNKIQPIQAG